MMTDLSQWNESWLFPFKLIQLFRILNIAFFIPPSPGSIVYLGTE